MSAGLTRGRPVDHPGDLDHHTIVSELQTETEPGGAAAVSRLGDQLAHQDPDLSLGELVEPVREPVERLEDPSEISRAALEPDRSVPVPQLADVTQTD